MKSLNNKGLSLVELVTAIAILAIAGTMLYYGFVAASDVHAETIKLQMAEDVAQHLSEEFKTHPVDILKTIYPDNSSTSGTLGEIYTFNIPSYTYNPRAGNANAQFSAKVVLTPKETVTDETVRTTTYKQNADETGNFAAVNTVGTNSFVVPEVINVYDGNNVVVREELNEYDAIVVSNLMSALGSAIQKKNEGFAANSQPQVSLDAFTADYYGKFIPLANMYNKNNTDIVKTTNIEIVEKTVGTTASYYYVVNMEYKFTYDCDLPLMRGSKVVGSIKLKDLLTTSDIKTTVQGATSVFTVEKSGNEYTVKYETVLDDELTGSHNKKGTIAGKIAIKDESGNEITYKADGTQTDKIAYVYFLYKPFNIYKDSTNINGDYKSSDVINFKYTGSGKNIVRAFFVPQELKHGYNTDKEVVVENCNVDSLIDFNTEMQVFTNSSEIIDASSSISEKNYLTNSYGKNNVNLYDMEITITDKEGNTKTITTVKED